MSFPRYESYKDSGVEWLGEVPEHWEILPCRAFVDEQTAKNDDGNNEDYLSLMANTGIIPYEEKGDIGNKKPEDLTKCKLVSRGDLVINSMNYGIGSYGLSDLNGICSPVYIVLRPRLNRIESRYAFRIFENREFQTYAQSFGNGILAHRAAINWDILKVVGVGLPPKEEQVSILNFLDSETAKIDSLIAEQQRLIELLKENRRAVISHAIRPQSGEKTTKLGHLIDLKAGYSFQSEQFSQDEEGMRLLRGINVGVGACRWDETVYWTGVVDHKIMEFSLAKDDIVLGMDRPWISSGTRVAQISKEDLPCLLVQRVARIRARSGQSQFFIRLLLISNEFKSYLEADLTGVSVPHISPEQICSFPARVLPQSQQVQIAMKTEQEFLKLDTLMNEAQTAITLLQERRTALISAAVTGKIDVRGLVSDKPKVEHAA